MLCKFSPRTRKLCSAHRPKKNLCSNNKKSPSLRKTRVCGLIREMWVQLTQWFVSNDWTVPTFRLENRIEFNICCVWWSEWCEIYIRTAKNMNIASSSVYTTWWNQWEFFYTCEYLAKIACGCQTIHRRYNELQGSRLTIIRLSWLVNRLVVKLLPETKATSVFYDN